MQINKLIYICHGWAWGKLERPLIDNSSGQIEAWKYGPVVRGVYHRLKQWESEKITYDSFCAKFDSYGSGKDSEEEFLSKKLSELKERDPEICTLLDTVWDIYKDVTGGQLIALTHKDETPWKIHVRYNFFTKSNLEYISLTQP